MSSGALPYPLQAKIIGSNLDTIHPEVEVHYLRVGMNSSGFVLSHKFSILLLPPGLALTRLDIQRIGSQCMVFVYLPTPTL